MTLVETRVLAVDPRTPDPGVLREAVAVLRAGGLVAFPTETVYGLGGRALVEASLARIFAAKGRPTHHPLIAHVAGEEDGRALARLWPAEAARFAAAFWPGPLTLVVERAASVPPAIAGGGPSIAVRAPRHPVARALVLALGEPIAAPSANRYQSLSPTEGRHVLRSLSGRIELLLDGGPCDAGIESTVVDLRGGGAPRVLRPGAVPLAALRAVDPRTTGAALGPVAGDDAPRPSPGMDGRHYAPRAELHLVPTAAAGAARAAALLREGRRVALVLRRSPVDDAPPFDAPLGAIAARFLPDDAVAYARALFSTLHELDEEGAEVVIVQGPPDDEAWWGVADRLRRASVRPGPR